MTHPPESLLHWKIFISIFRSFPYDRNLLFDTIELKQLAIDSANGEDFELFKFPWSGVINSFALCVDRFCPGTVITIVP